MTTPRPPRIRSLTATRVKVPFRRPFVTATGEWTHRDAWILALEDGDGRVGLGEAVLEPHVSEGIGELAGTQLALFIREAAREAADGHLPAGPELEGLGAPGRALRAALDSALLDLAGDSAHPFSRHDGDGIPVNATIGFGGADAGARAAHQAVAAGFTTLKLKAGTERETDALVERIRAIREAVGPEPQLRIDVNGAWDLSTAEERIRAIERFEIEYVEQPLPADEIELHAELRGRVEVPIALDESVTSAGAARAILAIGAADVLVVKPSRVGGPAVVAEIADRADEHEVGIVISTLFETGIGIAGALAAAARLPDPDEFAHGLATAGLLEDDLLVDGLQVDEGHMWVPGGPGTGGLGIALDRRSLERFATERADASGREESPP